MACIGGGQMELKSPSIGVVAPGQREGCYVRLEICSPAEAWRVRSGRSRGPGSPRPRGSRGPRSAGGHARPYRRRHPLDVLLSPTTALGTQHSVASRGSDAAELPGCSVSSTDDAFRLRKCRLSGTRGCGCRGNGEQAGCLRVARANRMSACILRRLRVACSDLLARGDGGWHSAYGTYACGTTASTSSSN